MTTARPAPSGAKDQVARLLTLVPFLHARGQVRLDDAAAALGVPADQLVKDLKVLLMCGLPGGYPDDLIDVDLDALEGPEADGVIRVSNADYLARPLRLTPTEATAIIVALRALRNGATDETRVVVDRALAKLEAAAAEGTAAPRIDPGDEPVEADLSRLEARLRDAARRQRQVRLTYFVPSRDEESERTVDPRGVVTANGFAYLDAWCHSAEAPRLFRLDRIHEAEVLETAIETPPEAPRDLGDGLFAQSSETTRVRLLLEPAARWVVEYYPVESVRQRARGRLEVALQVADERWLQRVLLRLAPHARVISPPELTTTFTDAAQAALSLYNHPGVR
ncbi:proteasome accessory factor C [Nocardioides ginsengisegetis]|uniref:Proteasome accessory factor C n=1 Tax=Nocardioides ginsengisegetis TaxID=661491 RepID=A0A7W3P9F5_9ACTN|nr:WYL domain-containing protein [Nocardioides ginsengisegetis]MBA8803399.1 proteasome accessory factor C [Nocardioides ginsengisegetis]